MAAGQESLGEAVLTLLVDSKTFKSQIDAAKDYVKSQLGQIDVGAGSGTGSRPRGSKSDPRNSWAELFRQAELYRADLAAQAKADAADLKKKADKDAADAKRARASRQRSRQQRVSSGLIGGAFPLLFGQGPGAALGGAIGGAVGGGPLGFALSLVGTVVGQAADQLVQKLSTLGSALKDPITNVSELSNSVSLSSSSLAKYSQSLIAVGRQAEAAALIQLDIAESFGDTSKLTELSDAQDKLGRSTEKLAISIGSFVAGPLAQFLEAVNNVVKSGPATGPDGLPNFENDLKRIEEQQRRSQAFQFGSLAFGLAGLPLALTGMALDPGRPGADVDTFMKNIQAIKTEKNLTKDIRNIRLQIASTEDVVLRKKLEISRLELERTRALKDLGEDPSRKPEREKVRADFQEKILGIEREITREVEKREDKQRKAAQDLLNLRLRNLKFLPEAEKQGLLREEIGPSIQRARLQGIPLRSISEAIQFRDFEVEQQRLRGEAGPQLINSNSQLSGTLQSTADVVRVLTASMDSLQRKNWEVHVTIPGQNGTKAGIDAVSGLSS